MMWCKHWWRLKEANVSGLWTSKQLLFHLWFDLVSTIVMCRYISVYGEKAFSMWTHFRLLVLSYVLFSHWLGKDNMSFLAHSYSRFWDMDLPDKMRCTYLKSINCSLMKELEWKQICVYNKKVKYTKQDFQSISNILVYNHLMFLCNWTILKHFINCTLNFTVFYSDHL